MGSESGLWDTVSKNMKGKWVTQRVENMVGPGTPDVYYTINGVGVMGWIENKHVEEWPKRPTTTLKIDHFTPQQRGWLRRHGGQGANVFVLLQVGRDYFLMDWDEAQNIGGKYWDENHSDGAWTKDDFEQVVYKWKGRIDYKQLLFVLS